MELIILSDPSMFKGEDVLINALFEAGMGCLHFRKPGASCKALDSMINKISPDFRNKVVMHQHYSLAFQYGLQGIHLPERTRKDIDTRCWLDVLDKIDQHGMTLSTAVHSRQVLMEVPPLFDYVLMSPVFNSISKPGYAPQEDMDIGNISHEPKVFALGGIDTENISKLEAMGYQGAAVLGAIWQNPASALDNFMKIKAAF